MPPADWTEARARLEALANALALDGLERPEIHDVFDGFMNDTGELDLRAAIARIDALEERLNTPELHDFADGVVKEAAHQRERWGSEHDAGKAPEDWFWLIGYLAGKALHAAKTGDRDKALHHTISTAAALANWHAALNGDDTSMRPGIVPPDGARAVVEGREG